MLFAMPSIFGICPRDGRAIIATRANLMRRSLRLGVDRQELSRGNVT